MESQVLVHNLMLVQCLPDYIFKESTPELKNLATRSKSLKSVLAKVPEAIADRPKFLTLIREIATAIKATLEGVSAVFQNNAKLLGGKASVSFLNCFSVHSNVLIMCIRTNTTGVQQ